MDPNVTLAELVDDLEHGDLRSAAIHHEALVEWITNGGFLPVLEKPERAALSDLVEWANNQHMEGYEAREWKVARALV